MKSLITLAALILTATTASASYDNTWYKTDLWTGEYPMGVGVVGKGVTVYGRRAIDKQAPKNVRCALPYRAYFHQWNQKRAAKLSFVTLSKIVPLIVKDDFVFETRNEDDQPVRIPLKKGDTVEFLVNIGEGFFFVRVGGQKLAAEQDLLERVGPVAEETFVHDQWLKISCLNGKQAWLFTDDLIKTDANGDQRWMKGLTGTPPDDFEYGHARDYTDKEAKERAK